MTEQGVSNAAPCVAGKKDNKSTLGFATKKAIENNL